MGWVKSPPIGQTITWALILASSTGGTLNASLLDIDVAALRQYSSTPRWIPLLHGGGIFVILDNILVVTPYQHVRDAWFQHIYNNAEKSHAVLKAKPPNPTDPPLEPFSPLYREALVEQSHVTLQAGSKEEFDFMGIHWTHGGHYLKVPEEDRQSPVPPGTCPEGSWSGTRRELGSILGKLNYHRRVYGRNLYDGSRTAEHIRAAYKVITPPDNRWSSRMSLDSAVFLGIAQAWTLRNQQELQAASPQHGTFENPKLVSGDAASKTNLAAAVFYGRDRAAPLIVETWKHYKVYIGLAELFAILQIVESDHCLSHDLIVLATDSMTCKAWIERGCAASPQANEMLDKIFGILKRRGQRLYVIYVPTDENSADAPTREKDLEMEKVEKTRKRLEIALAECQGLWSISGGTAGTSALLHI